MKNILMIRINKPKKKENGTYEATIYHPTKRENVKLVLENSFIIDIKNEGYLLLANKRILPIVSEIDDDIIKVVKTNCENWFPKHSLSNDIIEQYYTSNIIFDKKKNDSILKINCINDIKEVPTNVWANVTLKLKTLRFYKQKFVTEWEVCEVEVLDSLDLGSESEDEPSPTPEEFNSIKEKYIDAIQDRIAIYKSFQKELEECNDFSKLSILCDKLDDFVIFEK